MEDRKALMVYFTNEDEVEIFQELRKQSFLSETKMSAMVKSILKKELFNY